MNSRHDLGLGFDAGSETGFSRYKMAEHTHASFQNNVAPKQGHQILTCQKSQEIENINQK